MPFVSYNFNADAAGTLLESAVSETGGPWTKGSAYNGSSVVVSAAGRIYNAAGTSIYTAAGTPPAADYDVEADFVYLGNAPNYVFVGSRMDSTGNVGYIAGTYGGANWTIFRNLSQKTSGPSTTLNFGQSYHVKVTTRTIGSTAVVSIYVDGTLQCTYTDSSPIASAGNAGIYFGSATTATTGVHVDNFAASNPLYIGTLTSSATSSAITLALSASLSGGSGAGYAYSVYRSTLPTVSPAAGSLLAANVSLPYVDTTASGSTVYYYRVVGTDSAADAVTATLGGLANVSGGPYATPGQLVQPAPAFAVGGTLGPVNLIGIGDSITAGYTLSSPGTQSPIAVMASALSSQGVTVSSSNAGNPGTSTTEWQPGGTLYNNAIQSSNANSSASVLHAASPAATMVFNVDLGVNDSAISGYANGNKTKSQYKAALKAIVDQIVLTDWPTAKVILHYPTYFTPNSQTSYTYGEGSLALVQQYEQAISELAAAYATTIPGQVFVGDTFAFGYFSTRFGTELTGETGGSGTFYLHPNVTGAADLGSFWARAAYNAIARFAALPSRTLLGLGA